MRLLFITTVGSTMHFFTALIRELLNRGHTVDIACNENISQVPDCYYDWGCRIHHIDCVRSPFSIDNVKTIGQIRRVVCETSYDIVHCHTPIAAFCTRIACKNLRKEGTRVFYTAHGFHFYKGAPLKNWLLYYPAEMICAHFTDTLITINQEDYVLAERKMKAKQVVYVPGVGIDVDKFRNTVVDRTAKRRSLGIPDDAFLLLSVGELNENKNHQIVIRALAELNAPSIHYVIAGNGILSESLMALAAQLGVADRVHLLGYRSDVAELYKIADVYILPSLREGLNVSIMEAMASGLPVVCNRIRGNVDLVNTSTGILCDSHGTCELPNAICCLYMNQQLREKMGQSGACSISHFSQSKVNEKMIHLYIENLK